MAARGPSPTYAKWEWQQITEQTPERSRFLAQVTPVLHIKSDSFRLPFVPSAGGAACVSWLPPFASSQPLHASPQSPWEGSEIRAS